SACCCSGRCPCSGISSRRNRRSSCWDRSSRNVIKATRAEPDDCSRASGADNRPLDVSFRGRITMPRGRFSIRLTLLLLSTLASRLEAEDWPQFRGHNSSGVSTSRGLPTTFSHEDKVLWQATLGDGIGSPVIARGRVFTTAMTGPKKLAVFCHDAATGKQLWKAERDTGPLPRIKQPHTPTYPTQA